MLEVSADDPKSNARRLNFLVGRALSGRTFRHFVTTALPALRRCARARVHPVGGGGAGEQGQQRFAAVILEARAHFALEYVILSTMATLVRGWVQVLRYS